MEIGTGIYVAGKFKRIGSIETEVVKGKADVEWIGSNGDLAKVVSFTEVNLFVTVYSAVRIAGKLDLPIGKSHKGAPSY